MTLPCTTCFAMTIACSCLQAPDDRSDAAIERRGALFELLLPHPRIDRHCLDQEGRTVLYRTAAWVHCNYYQGVLLRFLLQLAQQHGMDVNHKASAVLQAWAGQHAPFVHACRLAFCMLRHLAHTRRSHAGRCWQHSASPPCANSDQRV